jgi:hypothetical protein
VLDYWEPDELEIPAREPRSANSDHDQENHPCDITIESTRSDPTAVDSAELPACCGTGCAVCVLDYPELFSKQKADSETLAMLEAIEQAQRQALQTIGNQDRES